MVRLTARVYLSCNLFASLSTPFSTVRGQHLNEMTSKSNKLRGWRGAVKRSTGEREGYCLLDWQPDGPLLVAGEELDGEMWPYNVNGIEGYNLADKQE